MLSGEKIKLRKFLIPAILSLVIFLPHLDSQLLAFLQYDKNLIASGEIWRVFTGHFVHWSVSHLFWDLLTFFILAVILFHIGHRGVRALWLISGISPLIISFLLWFLMPEITFYRGLSGIDVALFSCTSLYFISRILKGKNYIAGIFGITTFMLMIGKIAYETLSGNNIFVPVGEIIPLPLVHLIGAIIGMVCFFILRLYHPDKKRA